MRNLPRFGLAVAIAALMAPTGAKATEGWYAGGSALTVFQTDADSKAGGVTDKVQSDTGWGLMGNGGYGWANGLRAEGELAYRYNDIDKVTGTGSGATSSGHLRNLSLMANGFYDFNTATRFTPYVGAGLGGSFVQADKISSVNGRTLDDDRLAFAYQAIAGVKADIDDHWAVTADYRYFATLSPEFKTNLGGHATTENGSNNIVIGVRYSFGEPSAPPVHVATTTPPEVKLAPATPPVVKPVRESYVVFFDFDKATLTPEAQNVLATAAENFKKGHFVKILVRGHTDTMGTNKYNKKLSERRALAVEKAFEKLGLPADQIATTGVGETALSIPTNDQVREAQNRRAEIVFDKETRSK